MSQSEKQMRKEAKAFAEETAFVLLWELHRRKRVARRNADSAQESRIDATACRVREQRCAMRRISDANAIRACADEWQSTLGAIDVLL